MELLQIGVARTDGPATRLAAKLTAGKHRRCRASLTAEHMPRAAPAALLDKFWNPMRNFLVLNVQAPMHWPLVLAHAAQDVIVMSKDALDPATASKLVMETATAMAKIDPAKVHYAYFQAY